MQTVELGGTAELGDNSLYQQLLSHDTVVWSIVNMDG